LPRHNLHVESQFLHSEGRRKFIQYSQIGRTNESVRGAFATIFLPSPPSRPRAVTGVFRGHHPIPDTHRFTPLTGVFRGHHPIPRANPGHPPT
jgi:hypothetical protein